jgi:hypothetical protein
MAQLKRIRSIAPLPMANFALGWFGESSIYEELPAANMEK